VVSVFGCISSFAVVFGIWITSLIGTLEAFGGPPSALCCEAALTARAKGNRGRLRNDSSLSVPELASLTVGAFLFPHRLLPCRRCKILAEGKLGPYLRHLAES